MKLREEMAQRAVAVTNPDAPNPLMSGWTIESEDWSRATQAAVDQIMACTNALFDMVLRLAETIDELRDSTDIEGDVNGG